MRLSPRTVGVVVSLLISTVSVIAQDPIRVFVSDGESWEMGGGFAALTGDDFSRPGTSSSVPAPNRSR